MQVKSPGHHCEEILAIGAITPPPPIPRSNLSTSETPLNSSLLIILNRFVFFFQGSVAFKTICCISKIARPAPDSFSMFYVYCIYPIVSS